MRFVWLDVPGGGAIPINPDQVAYLRNSSTQQGQTQVVFGAVPGGLHSVHVVGDGREVAERLQGGPEAAPEARPAPAPTLAAPKAKGPPKRTALKRGRSRP